MDLIASVRRAAFRRPHILVVATPAAVATRLAVERYVRERGWPVAGSPADADVLAVLGFPDDDLAQVVAVLESQLPAPWIRVDLATADEVQTSLDDAPARLAQWRPASRSGSLLGNSESRETRRNHEPEPGDGTDPHHGGHQGPEAPAEAAHSGHGGTEHAEQEFAAPSGHGEAPHAGQGEHGGHDMAGHGDHGMAGHGDQGMGGHGGHGGHHEHMGPVAGLPMASRAPDRDGLKLDVLHVPLGPVLPYWPAGLRLSLTVQGDVVQEATAEMLGLQPRPALPFWDAPGLRALDGEAVALGDTARRRAAAHLDSVMRLLGVSGWYAAASRSAVLRDRLLADEPGGPLVADVDRLGRRVLRSRTLRRMTSGLGVLDLAAAQRLGVTGPAAAAGGDVWARLVQWLHAISADLVRVHDPSPVADVEGPRGRLDSAELPSVALLAALTSLVVGAELAGVRLIVASLDPDVAELAPTGEVAAHG